MGYASDDKHFTRLTECVDETWTRQQDARRVHRLIIDHLLGEYHPAVYDKAGKGFATSIPLLSMAFRALCRHTISRSPRMLVNATDPGLKPWAEGEEQDANKGLEVSNIGLEMAECSRQSMVSFGTFCFCPQWMGTPNDMRLDLEGMAVDRADFFYDTKASWLEKADFVGDEFDMTIADIRDNPMFDESCRGKVVSNGQDMMVNSEGANVRRDGTRHQDLYDYARIRRVYERRRNMIYFYPREQPELKLAEMEWLGPRNGPYRFLYYEKVPGNAEPMSPLMHLLKKHRSFNLLDMKTIHQQQVAKSILAFTNASKEEAERIANAVCNQSALVENGNVRWLHFGGAHPDTVAMAAKQQKDFSYASSGVVDQFVQQGDTLGQERLLKDATNEWMSDMSGAAHQFVKGVCKDFYWFRRRRPDGDSVMMRKQVEGTKLSYTTLWTPDHRRMALDMEFEVDVEPYSYVDRSPQSRLADFLGALQLLFGMADQLMAQGISFDMEGIVRTIAKYKNLPELYDAMILNQDPMRLQQLLGAQPGGSASDMMRPNGRYRRESSSDGAGAEMELMRMFGRGQQPGMEAA